MRLVFSLHVAEGQDVESGWNGEVAWSELTDSRGGLFLLSVVWDARAELTGLSGEIDGFVQLPASLTDLPNGNSTAQITRLDIHTNGTDSKLPPLLALRYADCHLPLAGNATGYLVPTQGITIISDIDDILRITKIYQPKEGLLNTFARDMVPWPNMPDVVLPPLSLHIPSARTDLTSGLRRVVAPTPQQPISFPLPHDDPRASHPCLHAVHLPHLPRRLLRHTSAQLYNR